MKKRFTDIDKWMDPWFRNLITKIKLFWIFILDKCDNAGVWKPDYKTASFFIGENIEQDEALQALNQDKERVKVLKNRNLWIPDFIPFQYKNLNPNCAPHKQVLELIKKHNLSFHKNKLKLGKGLDKPYLSLKDIDKDKDIKKEWEEGKLQEQVNKVYEFYKYTLDRSKYQLTENKKDKIESRLSEPVTGIVSWADTRFLELLVAITEVSLTDFNMGANEQKKTYIELDKHCCRNQEQVEQRLYQALERGNLEKIKDYLIKEGYLQNEKI